MFLICLNFVCIYAYEGATPVFCAYAFGSVPVQRCRGHTGTTDCFRNNETLHNENV